jgi:hypothetical protein
MEWEEKIASGEKTQAQYDQGYPEAAPFPSVLMIFSTGFSYEGMNVLRDMGWVVETPRKSELIINGGGGQPIGHKDNEVVAGHYVVWKDI